MNAETRNEIMYLQRMAELFSADARRMMDDHYPMSATVLQLRSRRYYAAARAAMRIEDENFQTIWGTGKD